MSSAVHSIAANDQRFVIRQCVCACVHARVWASIWRRNDCDASDVQTVVAGSSRASFVDGQWSTVRRLSGFGTIAAAMRSPTVTTHTDHQA